MRKRVVGGIFLPHDQHRIGIYNRLGNGDVVGFEVGLVEVEADDIVFVGKGGEEHAFSVGLDGDVHGPVEIFFQLFQNIVLETDDRPLIHKVIGSMVKQAHGKRVATFWLFPLKLGNVKVWDFQHMSAPQHDEGEQERCD